MEIMLDLDGVLVAFLKGAGKYHNISFDPYPRLGSWELTPDIIGMSVKDFWQPLGHEFWANLEWYSDGEEILKLCVDAVGWSNICLLTSPTLVPGCASGKIEWIQKNIPKLSRQFLIGPRKHFCDDGKRILIDDADHNLRRWTGPAILVPRPWNSGYRIKTPAYECVKECMKKFNLRSK